MTCRWKSCQGVFYDYGPDAYPRYRCLSCGRSDDLAWEEKKAILQALAGEKQRWNYGAGQDLDIYRMRARGKK